MTDIVTRLWVEGRLPRWDGFYRPDGLARALRLDAAAPGGLRVGAFFDLDARLAAEPHWFSTVLGMIRTPLAGDAGTLVYGECGHGSEGYFARLDRRGDPIWVAHLEESNPFEDASVKGSLVTLTNNLGESVKIDLSSPEFGS